MPGRSAERTQRSFGSIRGSVRILSRETERPSKSTVTGFLEGAADASVAAPEASRKVLRFIVAPAFYRLHDYRPGERPRMKGAKLMELSPAAREQPRE